MGDRKDKEAGEAWEATEVGEAGEADEAGEVREADKVWKTVEAGESGIAVWQWLLICQASTTFDRARLKTSVSNSEIMLVDCENSGIQAAIYE